MWTNQHWVCFLIYFEQAHANKCRTLACSDQPFRDSAPEGLHMLTNISTSNAVAFSDNQTAIVVPAVALIPENVEFQAQTYGVYTTCQSITSLCVNPNDTGSAATLILNCPPSTSFNATTTSNNDSFGILDASGNINNQAELNLDTKCVFSKFV